MNDLSHHADWLSLVEISGPFLAEPVLKEAFPQGLEGLEASKRKMLRQAYDEWREAIDLADPDIDKLHAAWIALVLKHGLELDEDGSERVLRTFSPDDEVLRYHLPEYGVTLRPDYVVFGRDAPSMLIVVHDENVGLTDSLNGDGWSANPAERMVELCRATGIRLGLLTNGERWMLVDAQTGSATTFASWYARLWSQEPVTLQAFVNLLGVRRFYVDIADQLPGLLDRSLKLQDEVTDALGEQVRRAVEVLIQALDRADVDRDRQLLQGIEANELYEAGLTVMMRIVFLLSAEERGLLLLGDEIYEANYAVSTLRLQLRAESDEILERRWDAWSRLLALFRVVYSGSEHENMRLPALGGSLFDPDRFPFLEGRIKSSSWTRHQAAPLPIDNRTVLLLLEAVQLFRGRTLSYRALDVEQIGYVYEGLLERTVVRASEDIVALNATKNAKVTTVTLAEICEAEKDSKGAIEHIFQERTASSPNRISNDLAKPISDADADKLLTACQSDIDLRNRIRPYFHLLRSDPWGYPLVYPQGTFMVTKGTDRRETGTHYTPKSLTELIVSLALEPMSYIGPAEGLPRQEWKLKSPNELLELKVCDPAMGSGAFLVQACRWLAERLVESWNAEEQKGAAINADGQMVARDVAHEPLPINPEERQIIARRIIAEKCLYGVDLNPLAVELAKLSLWLVTLAKNRPFGFLDHNLRCGDSLLGITSVEQLEFLELSPGGKSSRKLFAHGIADIVKHATEIRLELRTQPIRTMQDVNAMTILDKRARETVELPSIIADALVGEYVAARGKVVDLTALSIDAGSAMQSEPSRIAVLVDRAFKNLNADVAVGKTSRRPFHWPLEFPEVFAKAQQGFDAIVGNPPFIGNKFWKERLGASFQSQAKQILGVTPGKIDLCVVFHRRANELLREGGSYGLLAADNISEGGAISVGLEVIVNGGNIFYAKKGMAWPGEAAVSISIICFFKGQYKSPKMANGVQCELIGPRLAPASSNSWEPRAQKNKLFSFAGVDNSKGLSFLVSENMDQYSELKNEAGSMLVPYISGDDITTNGLVSAERWALDVMDLPLHEIENLFPIAFRFLLTTVLPKRTALELKSYPGLVNRWWQFWNHRADLMRRLRKNAEFLAFSKNTTFPFCLLGNSSWIYTNKVVLIGIERGDEAAICLSSFFRHWLEKYSGGRLRGWLTISISDSIDTFPLPSHLVSDEGREAAGLFNETAVRWIRQNSSGLTGVVNAIHTIENLDPDICRLRELMSTIDQQVAIAFECDEIDMEYNFRKSEDATTKLSHKYEISQQAKKSIIMKMLEKNKSGME